MGEIFVCMLPKEKVRKLVSNRGKKCRIDLTSLHVYLMNLWNRDNAVHREYYLSYLCRDWNSNHYPDRLKEIEMHFMLEKTLDNYETEPIEDVLLYVP